ncbi:MAG: tRNA-intron lyase [Candidatus Marsarchaeota archaeon]
MKKLYSFRPWNDVAKGIFNGRSVLVLDKEEGGKLYAMGYYGRPLSVYKPKEKEISSEIELSPVEALYLAKTGALEVYRGERKLSWEELENELRKDINNFRELYMVYEDLKSKGYIVKPGMKFGADYAVYEYGPGIDHAVFLVHVVLAYDAFEPEEIVRAGRLSHGVRKRFVMAYPNVSSKKVEYVVFRWVKPRATKGRRASPFRAGRGSVSWAI